MRIIVIMRYFIALFLIIIVLSGCFRPDKLQAIAALKNLSQERDKQEKIIKSEREKFRLLNEAIRNNTIKKGLSQQKVRSLYGEPVLIKQSDISGIDAIFIFIEPLKYFDREKVYLYFDKDERLVFWEIKK